eukprot:gene579-1996_t
MSCLPSSLAPDMLKQIAPVTAAKSLPSASLTEFSSASASWQEAGAREKAAKEAANDFVKGVEETLPELSVIGSPEMSVVGVMAKKPRGLNMYKLNDWLTKNKGWHMNALQSPPALHFCFTAAHGQGTAKALVADMRHALDALASDPNCVSGGSAPMYGMANISPDRGMVSDFLVAYQDVMLTP